MALEKTPNKSVNKGTPLLTGLVLCYNCTCGIIHRCTFCVTARDRGEASRGRR